MSEETKTIEPKLPALVQKAPELIPLWDWWVKEGKSTVVMLLVAGVVVGGFYAGRNYLRSRNAKANAALTNAYTTEDLESAVASYGSSKPGFALKMRLAKSYYDAERYQDALDLYRELAGKADPAFVDIAKVGCAYALEGLAKYDEAQKAFADFAADAANATSYLRLTAQLGAARCTALAGKKDAALKDLEALKKAQKDDKMAEMRVDRLMDAVKRYDPNRKAPSLFDAANAAAKDLEAAKPAAKPVAPKAETKVAPKVPAVAPKAPAPKKPAK